MILLSPQMEGQMVQQEGLRGSSRQPQVYAGMMGDIRCLPSIWAKRGLVGSCDICCWLVCVGLCTHTCIHL